MKYTIYFYYTVINLQIRQVYEPLKHSKRRLENYNIKELVGQFSKNNLLEADTVFYRAND
jgi:hypothetical protein